MLHKGSKALNMMTEQYLRTILHNKVDCPHYFSHNNGAHTRGYSYIFCSIYYYFKYYEKERKLRWWIRLSFTQTHVRSSHILKYIQMEVVYSFKNVAKMTTCDLNLLLSMT